MINPFRPRLFLFCSTSFSQFCHKDTKQYLEYIEQVREKYRLDELPKVNTIEIRIGFLFKEPQICNEFIEKVVKRKIAELFNNIEIIVQHGAKE